MTNVERILIFRDVSGQWRWHALAANNEVVAQGEAHTRAADAERAALGVFPDATLVRESSFAPSSYEGDEEPVVPVEQIPGQMEVSE